jgi:hypothetical protein
MFVAGILFLVMLFVTAKVVFNLSACFAPDSVELQVLTILPQKMPLARISPPDRFLTCRLGGVASSEDGDEVVLLFLF